MLGLQNEREWVNFCDKVLQQPDAGHATRASPATPSASPSAPRCAQLIVDAFAPLTAPQVVERLEAAQIANARVNTMHEVWEHPQLKARDRWREVGSPAGRAAGAAAAGHLGRRRARAWTRCRRSGEHTDAILRRAGLSTPTASRALRAAEAI